MMIDWGPSAEDDVPPKLERWLLRRVLGYFRPASGPGRRYRRQETSPTAA
jgi:hypothetical protein